MLPLPRPMAIRRRSRCAAAALVLVVLAGVPMRSVAETGPGIETEARAEEQDAGEALPPEDQRTVHRAEDIRVRAERGRVEVFESAPIEQQEIERAEVKSLPGNEVSQIVATLPGFRTQQRVQGQRAAVSIEGMPAEYTLILVDGQRYTGAIGGVGDLQDVPVTNIDSVTVLRGAQALRQGSEAGGGVVYVATRPPPGQGLELHAEGGGGTQGRYVGMVTGGAALGPVGASLSYTRSQIDGYDRRDSGGVFVGVGGADSRAVVDDTYVRLSADVGDAAEVRGSLGWRVQADDYVGQGDFEGEPLGTRKTHRLLGGLEATWAFADFATFDGGFFYYGDRLRDTIGREVVLDEQELRLDPTTDLFFATASIDHTVTLGLDLRYAELDLETGSIEFVPDASETQLETLTRTKVDTWNAGLFVEWEAALTSWLDLLAGLRGQLDTRFEPAFTPQVALVARPFPGWTLRAQYGRSRRAPSLSQMHQPETAQNGGAYFLKGNPALVPESAHTYRLGVQWQPAHWLATSATGFYNDIDDHIRALYVGSAQVSANEVCIGYDCNGAGNPPPAICRFPGTEGLPECQPMAILSSPVLSDVLQYQNLQVVESAGVEVQARANPHELVDLRVGYTFMRTRVDFDARPTLDELPNEPRHTLNLVGRIRAPRISSRVGQIELGLDARYRSDALVETSGTGFAGFTSQARSDPSWVVDARLTLPFLGGDRAAVYFDVFNLTDEATVDSYEIRGRTYFAGLRFELESRPRP